MTLFHGPIGRLVKGHVLDVNERSFNKALRDYDPNLYTVWNPKKLKGWGCWEIRRAPNTKTAVYKGTHQGTDFYSLEYVELDIIHHVLDAAYLNYDAIRKIKSMDTWGNKAWLDQFEEREAAAKEKLKEDAREKLKYAIKQNRSMARDYMEAVRSGIHPAQVLLSSKWAL